MLEKNSTILLVYKNLQMTGVTHNSRVAYGLSKFLCVFPDLDKWHRSMTIKKQNCCIGLTKKYKKKSLHS